MKTLLLAAMVSGLVLMLPQEGGAIRNGPPLLSVRCDMGAEVVGLAAVEARFISGQMKLCRLFGGKVRGVVRVDA